MGRCGRRRGVAAHSEVVEQSLLRRAVGGVARHPQRRNLWVTVRHVLRRRETLHSKSVRQSQLRCRYILRWAIANREGKKEKKKKKLGIMQHLHRGAISGGAQSIYLSIHLDIDSELILPEIRQDAMLYDSRPPCPTRSVAAQFGNERGEKKDEKRKREKEGEK